MEITKAQLQNGLTVLLIDKRHLKTATILFGTLAGSVDEPVDKRGVCNLSNRMSLRGTHTVPETYDLNIAIESIGATISSSSGKQATTFTIHGARKYIDEMIPLISDIVQNPVDRERDLEMEKKIAMAEIDEIADNPQELALTKYAEQIYKDTPYESLSLGSKDHIPTVTTNDLKEFRKKYFNKRSILSVATDFSTIDTDTLMQLIGKHFNRKLVPYTKPSIHRKENVSNRQFVHKRILQPVVALGSYAPSYESDDFTAYKIARILLGVGFGGKVTQKIREQMHLAYYARAFYLPQTTIGIGGVAAGVYEKELATAIDTIRKILRMLQDGTFTNHDIRRAKGFYKGLLVGFNESSSSLSAFFANQQLFQEKTETFEKILEEVTQIKKDSLQKIFQQYFPLDNLALTIIGANNPYQNEDNTEKT